MNFIDEKKIYLPPNKLNRMFKIITKHPDVIFYRAVKWHKRYKKAKNNKSFLLPLYARIANKYSTKYNLELYGKYGKKLKIWHGNIVINGEAILGDNINLHGNNCIGSNGKCAPILGDNIDVGYGATIIGNIKLANNIVIGANSLVNKSFLEEGVTIVGIPARIIRKNS